MERVIACLNADSSIVTAGTLAEHGGERPRELQRLFRQAVGLGPKFKILGSAQESKL